MTQATTVVKNPTGIHARPASQLVAMSRKYASKITIRNGEATCDCKKIFSVLNACMKQGSEITICAEGADEEQAVADIKAFVDALVE